MPAIVKFYRIQDKLRMWLPAEALSSNS